jgi:hypothetical protein
LSESPANQPHRAWISPSDGARERGAEGGRRARLRTYAAPVFLAVATPALASLAILQPGDATNVMAIFPPWWTAERSVIAASAVGPVLGAGALPFMVAIKGVAPDVDGRLRAAGAVLIVDGRRFRVCATKL